MKFSNLLVLAVAVFMLVSYWKVFVKAGMPGWACLIPIYNAYVWLKIAGKPWWWLLLMLIPLVNVVFFILANIGAAERFGKGAGFGFGLSFLPFIFFPILAFGDSQAKPGAA
jgi:hypothetical protein